MAGSLEWMDDGMRWVSFVSLINYLSTFAEQIDEMDAREQLDAYKTNAGWPLWNVVADLMGRELRLEDD